MLLRKDDAWLENLPIPDIRNWRVVDQNGQELGFVETIVVDRQENAFEAVLIGANDRFSADELDIQDGVVQIERVLRPAEKKSEEPDASRPAFETSYSRHFEETYVGREWTYENLLPAYRFGREAASDADFSGRSFERAEEDLRALYVSRGFRPSFQVARNAVQHGYSLVHPPRPFEPGGLSR